MSECLVLVFYVTVQREARGYERPSIPEKTVFENGSAFDSFKRI
jgi:hypothetical protein